MIMYFPFKYQSQSKKHRLTYVTNIQHITAAKCSVRRLMLFLKLN